MISEIRRFLSKHHLDALLVGRTDSFLSEYYPPQSAQLKQATGFCGSAGMAVITHNQTILFVDSRYTEQAKIESAFQVYEIPSQTTPSDWLSKHLPGQKIGYNSTQRSVLWVEYMVKKGIRLVPVSESDWESLFPSRTDKIAPTFEYDISFCGESAADKIKRLTGVLESHQLDGYVLTVPDSVSWLLNQRSLSVPQYPVVFKRIIVLRDGTILDLHEDRNRLQGLRLGLDPAETPQSLFEEIRSVAKIITLPDPVTEMKSVKNPTEQQNIRQACLFESKILCRFLAWVEKNKATITEMDCDTKLQELRCESPLYRGDSFDTIAAVGEHAARAHYRADTSSNVSVSSAPMLLVDTGGNYLNGTTDMTRTICVGTPSPLMIKRYTQVLKGHIALATTPVHEGDLPLELDNRARSALQADGADYGHATGHGIGMYLAVHEAPPVIYKSANTPLQAGMLFSNEPGFYDAQAGFGIRLENMIMTLSGPDNSLILENLLWVPFDGRLIDFTMLTTDEKQWLKSYHQTIRDRIMPNLNAEDQSLLNPLLDFFTEIT